MNTEKSVHTPVKYRRAAIITLVSSILAFVLSLIALLSSARDGQLHVYDVVMLNTSTLLQNAIKVESAPPTTTREAKRDPQLFPTLPLPASNLPGASEISSLFAGVSSNLATAISPSETAAPGSPSMLGSGLLGDLESFLTGIAGNVPGNVTGNATGNSGNEMAQMTNNLVQDLVSAIGIKQWYSLYMLEYCEGDYTPNYAASNAHQNVKSCKKLTSSSLLDVSSTPSTIQLGQTVIDFSALNIPNKLSQAGGPLKRLFNVVFAFEIIGIICSGLLIVLAPPYVLFRIFQRRPVRLAMVGLTTLAFSSLATVAVIISGLVIVVVGAINELADGLGIEAHSGGSSLAMLWVSTVLMGLSSGAWFWQWHLMTFTRRDKGTSL